MTSKSSWRIRVAQILFGGAFVFAVVAVCGAQAQTGEEHVHLVTDWSHHRMVFSEPNSLMKRFELSSNTRYVQQVRRRNAEKRGGGQNEWRWHHAPDGTNHIQGDWSIDMGSGTTVGAGNYPAKYSFDPTSAYCATPAPPVGQQPDFVVYNTSLAGSGSQATIVAFDNLYTGTCTGGTPQTYWAYNTGTTGAVTTSPVLSYDGTQVAFVQNTGTGANLVILRWQANTGTLSSPVPLTAGPCTALTAPCMQTVPFSTANSDTNTADNNSSPYYDYGQDVLYVGDAGGFLHKFTGVFFGTPTEVVSTGPSTVWPASLSGIYGQVNSPVFAYGYNEILVTCGDGVLYVVDTTLGAVPINGVNSSAKLANFGFDDGPLLDITSGHLYLFARADITNSVASVFQFAIPANPAALHNATGTEVIVFNSATIPASGFYDGTFNDPYYNSTNGTGDLYVCSTDGSVNALWVIPISNSVMSTPTLGPTLTTANAGCSPITEFKNTTTGNDQIFLSVAGSAITGGSTQIKCPAASGCIMSFDVNSTLTGASNTSATASETGGTSGIVVDNLSSTTGASQVYFTPLSDQPCTTSGITGGCAIQASQTGLD
jgi:hypothetical protein